MIDIQFETFDVFTDRIFGGNPLAVFFDRGSLDDGTMQRIAAEMNLSETTFVTARDDIERFGVRIFTPKQELGFAGHPTIGSAVAIVRAGGGRRDPDLDLVHLILEEEAGEVPVIVSLNEHGEPVGASFRAPRRPEMSAAPHGHAEVAAVLGVEAARLHSSPPVCASAGTPFLFVRLADESSVDAVELNLESFAAHLEGAQSEMIFAYAWRPDGDVYARMFAPTAGISEDPATGSAAAAFGAIAFEEKGAGAKLRIVQGVRMGRSSQIFIELESSGAELRAVHVSGAVVHVMEGRLRIR